MTTDFVTRSREEAWAFGRNHREVLVAEWRRAAGELERPLLKDVIDDLIEDVIGARLREEVLPLDRFAQTELVDGRLNVSINIRTAEMPRVKDVTGVLYVAKWHESVHCVRDFPAALPQAARQAPLSLFAVEPPRVVVCRGVANTRSVEEKARESFAENAAVAAAVCAEDLARCSEYLELMNLAEAGGELGKTGWRLLYEAARFIGVNGTVLARYWEQAGLITTGRDGRLLAQPALRGFGRDG